MEGEEARLLVKEGSRNGVVGRARAGTVLSSAVVSGSETAHVGTGLFK